MKMIKKITSVFMTFLVMAALVIGSTSVVFAADKVDDTVKSTLVTTAEGTTTDGFVVRSIRKVKRNRR